MADLRHPRLTLLRETWNESFEKPALKPSGQVDLPDLNKIIAICSGARTPDAVLLDFYEGAVEFLPNDQS